MSEHNELDNYLKPFTDKQIMFIAVIWRDAKEQVKKNE